MLYEFNKKDPETSKKVKITTPADFEIKERHIEEFLKSRLAELVSEDHLMLIGQERAMQEEADLLALDRNGNLFIFELKRWSSSEENLLQVLRYGQKFGRYSYEELEVLAKRQNKLEGSLKEKHQDYFELEDAVKESNFNNDQVFVLVTNGTDEDTLSAIKYWADKNLDIKCSPYRVYEIEGKPFIQFDTFNPDGDVIEERNTEFYIVNTNRSYMSSAYKDMLGDLKTGKASAYYGRKFAVDVIPKNATVYLYHTRVGVIAKGRAMSAYAETDYNGDENEEHFVPLEFEWATQDVNWDDYAVHSYEINKRLNSGHKFRKTAFSITEEMSDEINKIYREKRENSLA